MSDVVIGAEVGSVGGPPGIVVGAVVGGILTIGGAYLLGKWIGHANEQADDKLKDSARDQPCAECGEVGCFNTPEGGDPAETERQLKDQQDTINSKSPDEILDRMNEFDKSGRPPDAAARSLARRQAQQEAYTAARNKARGEGKSPAEADAAGTVAAESATTGKDATHALDWVAGGDGEISGMGDSKTNRSVGSQWNQKAPGSSGTRREELRNAAEAAKKAGKKKMDVKLEEC